VLVELTVVVVVLVPPEAAVLAEQTADRQHLLPQDFMVAELEVQQAFFKPVRPEQCVLSGGSILLAHSQQLIRGICNA